MHAVLARHHPLCIGVPAHPQGIALHRPAALGPALPLLSVHVAVTAARPLLVDAPALLP